MRRTDRNRTENLAAAEVVAEVTTEAEEVEGVVSSVGL